MQVIFSVIIISASKEIDFVLDQYAVVTCSRCKIALISCHYLFPFSYLHIHEVFVSELRFQFFILFLSCTAGHRDGNKRMLDHVTAYYVTYSFSNPSRCHSLTTEVITLMQLCFDRAFIYIIHARINERK